MISDATTLRICRHMRALCREQASLTLDYVEFITEQQGHRVSRQTVSRALRGEIHRMQPRVARQLALFIESESEGRVGADWLLRPGNGRQQLPGAALRAEVAAQLELVEAHMAGALWGDALRCCGVAQDLLSQADSDADDLRRSLHERLGDLHLVAFGDAELARGHYQAALRWTRADRIRGHLLCKVCDTYHDHDRKVLLLDTAWRLSATGAVLVRKAEMALSHYRVEEAAALADEALEACDGDVELLHRARAVRMMSDGARGRRDHLLGPTDSRGRHGGEWAAARDAQATAQAWKEAGDLRATLSHLQEALTLLERLDSRSHLVGLHEEIGRCQLLIGDLAAARHHLLRAAEIGPACASVWTTLCKTWDHDHTPDGTAWALRAVREYCDASRWSAHAGRMSPMLPRRLGPAERLLALMDQRQAFIDEVGGFLDDMARLHVELPETWWLRGSVELPTLSCPSPDADWEWVAASPVARRRPDEDGMELETDHPRGISRMDVPRWETTVEGDFLLAATVHAESEVRASLARCRRGAACGEEAAAPAWAAGGLLVHAEGDVVRLMAHLHEPGEVIFQQMLGRVDGTPGRGYLGDGPLRLRLERRSDRVFAYAALDEGPWYSCGVAPCPARGGPVRAGVFAELALDQYHISRRARARFRHLSLTRM